MYIDTHAHLNFNDFSQDLEEVIWRAQKLGIKKIINIGTDLKDSQEVIDLAEQYSGLYATVSLHPINIRDEKFDLKSFKRLAQHNKVVAIGETGLDYQKKPIRQPADKIQMSKQKQVFKSFLDLADELEKPVIIHCRDAEDDLIKILKTQKKLPKGVWHCFMKDIDLAKEILNLGFMISFTGSITYNLSKKTHQVIKEIPLEKIIIETDCPFMTPLKQREKGIKRCEPAFIIEVAKKIAQIKNEPLSKIAQITTKNAERLFGI